MRLRDMLNRVRDWLLESRRRQLLAGISLGVIAAIAGIATYFAVSAGGDGGIVGAPMASPAATLPSPTPEPTGTATTNPVPPVPAKIFFLSSREPRGAYLMDADGSNLTWIGGMLQVPEVDIWSPDGSKVAFAQCPDKEEALQFDAGDRNSELIVANIDGSGEVNVSGHPRADVSLCFTDAPPHGFDWSPDGTRLAFYSYRDPPGLYVVNADGSGLAFLVDGVLPSWSPDGEVIAFIGEADEANREMDLEVIRPDGSDRTLLARIPCNDSVLWGLCVPAPSVRWSPDGALLTFSALPEPISGVFTLRADGSGLTQVTHPPGGDSGPIGGDFAPTWVDCTRPTAGCEANVTNVASEGLNVRTEPGVHASTIGKLGDGELVCFIGPSRFIDGFRWWPARSEAGIEGWSAAFDPEEPDRPWLTATGRACSETPEPTPTPTPAPTRMPTPTPTPTPTRMPAPTPTTTLTPATGVCGGIFVDTIWSATESPIVVTCDAILFPGNTLTIEPGVAVRFSAGTSLKIRGSLVAQGTESNHIVFTSTSSVTKGAWQGVHIANQLGGDASIRFADFFYAQTAVSVECCWKGGPVNIADSVFVNNRTALGGYAGWEMIIERSTFDSNDRAITRADKIISDSVFTNNGFGLSGTERISVFSSTFEGNDVALNGGRGEVQFSEIFNNRIGVQPFFEGLTLRNNTITNNDIGVILSRGYDTPPPVENNNIHGNTTYDLKNAGPSDKSIPNNWWGTTDTAQIDARIYDGFDNPALGRVHYMPILTAPVDISGGSP